jgi:hypothetical protein
MKKDVWFSVASIRAGEHRRPGRGWIRILLQTRCIAAVAGNSVNLDGQPNLLTLWGLSDRLVRLRAFSEGVGQWFDGDCGRMRVGQGLRWRRVGMTAPELRQQHIQITRVWSGAGSACAL